jgi:site-specific recombinase XerD
MDPSLFPDKNDSFKQLERHLLPKILSKKVSESQFRMASEMLAYVLFTDTGDTEIENLESVDIDTFSAIASSYVTNRKWSKPSMYCVTRALKHILTELNYTQNKLARLRVRSQTTKDKRHKILSRAMLKLPKDGTERKRLERWIVALQTNTKMNCDSSIRNAMNFIIHSVLPAIGLTLENWPDNASSKIETFCNDKDNVVRLCGDSGNRKKRFHWLKLFATMLEDSADRKCTMKDEWITKVVRGDHSKTEDDGNDHHRISKDELEKIEQEAKKDPLDNIIFRTLLFTGMRVGGLVAIETENIAEKAGGSYKAKPESRTIEKGRKPFTFIVGYLLKPHVESWLNKHRPASKSKYFLPAAFDEEESMSTETIRDRFKKMCARAGLEGPQFHPHALRHSYAHIMLESGNSAETVSKSIGHASVKTTNKFYLKETATQALSRMKSPFHSEEDFQLAKQDPVPKFVKDANPKPKKRRRKIAAQQKALNQLAMFDE